VVHQVSAAEDRFRELFESNFRPLLAYALRRTEPREEAADVVAETFLVAWRRLDDVPEGAAARPWLFGVARRILSNQVRGQWRRSRLVDRLRGDLIMAYPATPVTEATVVGVALNRLDEADRELLRLTAWEGLTPSDLAVVMDIPPGTARSRLHRARSRLRVELLALGWDERLEVVGHVGVGERLLARDAGCD